jgi:hypothetical protein
MATESPMTITLSGRSLGNGSVDAGSSVVVGEVVELEDVVVVLVVVLVVGAVETPTVDATDDTDVSRARSDGLDDRASPQAWSSSADKQTRTVPPRRCRDMR